MTFTPTDTIDYAVVSQTATVNVAKATPTVIVSGAGGPVTGAPYPATATVAGVVSGVDSTPAASLEGVTPTMAYYAGATATGTPLSGAPSAAGAYTVVANFSGSADYMSAASSPVTFIIGVPPALPAGWTDLDIGTPPIPGSASFNASTGLWTVAGSGQDIYNNADQFNFASESFNGNGTLTAQVNSVTNTYSWAKSGLMFRASNAAGAQFADVVITPKQGVAFQWRSTTNGSCGMTVVAGIAAPSWIQLTRTGNSFSAFYSVDGVTWKQIGTSETIAMPTAALAGLAVTSVNLSALNTSTFSNVDFSNPGSTTITVTPPAAQTAISGQSQLFALGSFNQPNAAGPFTVTVNWGDGSANSTIAVTSAGTIPAVAHTFAGSGKDTVTVKVVDSANHTSNSSTFAVTVAAPVTTITVTPPAAQTAIPGQSQSFALGSFAQTNAAGPFTVTVNWGDGSTNSSFAVTSAGAIPATAHTFAGNGSDTVTVTVVDSANDTSNSPTFAVNVAAPVTTLTVTPPAAQTAIPGQSQSFALGSFAQTNATGPFTVTVNWGDGSANSTFAVTSAGTIPATAHTFASGESDTVTVTVSDSANNTSNSPTFAVAVAAASITVTPPAAQAAIPGQSESFALGSFSQTNATGPFTVTVNWGDGSANSTFAVASAGTIPATAHTFAGSGGDTVTVTVVDSANDTSNSPTFVVTVAAPVTTITVTPPAAQTAILGQSQSFALGSITQSNATGPFTVTVNWGDGSANSTIAMASAGTIPVTAHTFAGSGSDTVTVTIVDSANDTSNSPTFTVTVAAPITTITVTPPVAQTAIPGQSQSFALGSFTQTNATGPFAVTVNWGDGSTNSSFAVTSAGAIPATAHTFAGSGSDTVTVTVTDSAHHTSNSPTFAVTVAAATISGAVFEDSNGDGTMQSEEPGLAGFTVYADLNNNAKLDAGEPSTTTTDSTGHYSIGGLNSGGYVIRILTKTGYKQTAPPAAAQTIAVAGKTVAGPSLGEVPIGPYGGTPAAFTLIQAENFDLGGQNTGYYNPGNTNRGGLYRPAEGVGIGAIPSANGGGDFVGYTLPGEYLNYTVTVSATGTYTLNFRVASDGKGGTFHLNVDGKNVTGELSVPSTGDWNVYTIASKTGVKLTAGTHVLQLVIDSAGASGAAGNFDWLQAVKTA